MVINFCKVCGQPFVWERCGTRLYCDNPECKRKGYLMKLQENRSKRQKIKKQREYAENSGYVDRLRRAAERGGIYKRIYEDYMKNIDLYFLD